MQPTRRTWLLGGGAVAALSTFSSPSMAAGLPLGLSTADPDDGARSTLWYDAPAADWLACLPLGNGRLGALCDSGPGLETLQLNEDTFWSGGPYGSTRPGAHRQLQAVRDLIFAGKPLEAQVLLEQGMMAVPSRQMPFQTLGELQIRHLSETLPTKAYQRRLDLSRAVLTTTFEQGDNRYEREIFISAPDQMLVYRCRIVGPGHLDADLGYSRAAGVGLTASESTKTFARLDVEGVNASAYGVEGRLRFFGGLEAQCEGGRIEARDDHLEIRGAKAFELRVAIATNFVTYKDVSGDPRAIALSRLAAGRSRSFETLKADHIAEHARLFDRFDLDFGPEAPTPAARLTTDRRIARNALAKDPGLAALLVQYGRYLLICCSRPGTQPANLQGLWNREDSPIWGSKYTININTQMNYWAAESVGLEDCVEPLVELVRDLSVTGQAAARDHWNAGGWCAHHNTDLWRAAGPIDRARSGYWPTGGAWLCKHLYERWLYNGDDAYLASIWPVLRGAAQFFLDSMVVDPAHGYFVTCPSLSPENKTPLGTALCAGPYMDTEIIRDLFVSVASVTEVLGVENEFRDQINARLARLAPFKIGKAGQLQEWLEDWDLEAPDRRHRHVSHLYAVYPGAQISPEKTPALAAAAIQTLTLRGDVRNPSKPDEIGGDFGLRYGAASAGDNDTTGWGLAWRSCLWSRLGEPERSFGSLARLTSTARLQPNMFALHPPFQIDANFGAMAAVVEMLLRNTASGIDLLPSLPTAFASGHVRGLRAHGDVSIDMVWRRSRLVEVTLRPRRDLQITLRYGAQSVPVVLERGKAVRAVTDRAGRIHISPESGRA